MSDAYDAGPESPHDAPHEAGGGAQPSAAPSDWTSGLPDDSAAFARTKGWRSPAEMLASYRSLEGLLGGEKLPVPQGEADAEGYDRIYRALGRPDAPEGYGLTAPEGADPALAEQASRWFHEAGLSAKQGQALAERWNAHVAQAAQVEAEAFQARSREEIGDVRRAWGDRFDANVEIGRRAAAQFGLDGRDIAGLEHALGTRRMLETLRKIGAGLGEHSFEAGDTRGGGFRLTPDAARARTAALKADKGWTARYLAGDADAKAEMTRLQQAAAEDR